MRESARPTGVCRGRILATPISSRGVNPGACVLLARKHATCGRPMPTTTISLSRSSRAPAATMISVARIPVISVTQHRIGLEAFQMPKAAYFFQIRVMILGRENVVLNVLADAFGALGMIDVELQMGRVVIVAAKDGGRMRAKRLVDNRFDAVGWNNGAFRFSLNRFGRHDLFSDYDQPTRGLGLLFVFPTRSIDAAIALGVGRLHMYERNVRGQSRHRKIGFAGERAFHGAELALGAALFEAFEDFGGEQRFDRNEGEAERAGEVAKADRQAGPILESQRARLAGAVDAMNRTKAVERAAADNQTADQTGADEEVGIEARDPLRYR